MDRKSLTPWLLAAAGLTIMAAGLKRGKLVPPRSRSLKDRHIMVLVGKHDANNVFICGADVLPERAIVNKGKKVYWHIVNQCEATVHVEFVEFRNAQGEDPFRSHPDSVYVSPQGLESTDGKLRGDARDGSYTYKVLINGQEIDPELIMQ